MGFGLFVAAIDNVLSLDDEIGVVGAIDEVDDDGDALLLDFESALAVVSLSLHAKYFSLALLEPVLVAVGELGGLGLEVAVPAFEFLDLAVEAQLLGSELLILGGNGLKVLSVVEVLQVLQAVELLALEDLAGDHVDKIEEQRAALDGNLLDWTPHPVRGVDCEAVEVYLHHASFLEGGPKQQVDLYAEGRVSAVDEKLRSVGEEQLAVQQRLPPRVRELRLALPDLDVRFHAFLYAQRHLVHLQKHSVHRQYNSTSIAPATHR